MTYGYDTNSVNGAFSHYSQGRLTTAQYMACAPGSARPVTEMYSYHPAGRVTAKQMAFCAYPGDQNNCTSLEGDYAYDTAGRVANYAAATSSASSPAPLYLSYAYDALGRAITLTDNLGARSSAGNRVWVTNGQ